MSIGSAKRILGTVNRAMAKTFASEKIEWDYTVPEVIYGYLHSRIRGGYPHFELKFGVIQLMAPEDPSSWME